MHKDSIDIAVAEPSRDGEVRHIGTIGGDLPALDRALRKLVSGGRAVHIVYESGPCGFVIYRHLTAKGLTVAVVARSSIPRKPGDRIKTDRRDALQLARLARNGMPDAGKTAWTAAHRRWLATVKLPQPAQQIVFQEYLHAVTDASLRIGRLEQTMQEVLAEWPLRPVVEALQALRGIQALAAMTIVAEIQDFHRFPHPRHRMAYLGLIPGEHSAGPHRRQASITKAGNGPARRILVEVAWRYRYPARATPITTRRQNELPKAITDRAWQAPVRPLPMPRRAQTAAQQSRHRQCP